MLEPNLEVGTQGMEGNSVPLYEPVNEGKLTPKSSEVQADKESLSAMIGEQHQHEISSATDILAQVTSQSNILESGPSDQISNESSLSFLKLHLPLSSFKKASKIFATRDFLPETDVAPLFHKACDNVPNVLVIIKSGQYIAGGYTEVPFESRNYDMKHHSHLKPDASLTTRLFSVTNQTVYGPTNGNTALNCDRARGPSFGWYDLVVASDYAGDESLDALHKTDASFGVCGVSVSGGVKDPVGDSEIGEEKMGEDKIPGVLFGKEDFTIDEYEVYKLE